MFVDIYGIIGIALLFGFCAYWNHKKGIRFGIEATLDKLLEDKIIDIKGDKIVPYRREQKALDF